MSDAVEKIVEAIKEAAHDVGDAVKAALHIPDNLAPLMATLTSLTAEGAKFASGEGSSEAAAGVVKQLQELSKLVDGMEEGPLRKMVMSLKNEAVGKLQGVNGAEKILAILTIIGTPNSGKVDEIAAAPAPAATTPAAPAATTPAAPAATTPAATAPVATPVATPVAEAALAATTTAAEPIAVVAAVEPSA